MTAPIKCLVWDLDRTLWDGVLLEDGKVALRPGAVDVIRALDARGILQSIASKNDPAAAGAQLADLGLDEYFLYPQITWNAKSESIKAIATSLNLGLDALALIDDEAFERDEVRHALPEVRCFDAAELAAIPQLPEFNPRFITDDSKHRRQMYLADKHRNAAESDYEGPREEFLATLDMAVTIAEAQEDDLMRAEELTVRTHQLNTTGVTYSYEELDAYRRSPNHKLVIMQMADCYGSYGRIGLALVECSPEAWTIKLLLMSCRVMTRGVGTIMIAHLMRLARDAGALLRAEFVANDRNRLMYVTYRFAGFREIANLDGHALLEHDLAEIHAYPAYVRVQEKPTPCRAPAPNPIKRR